MKNIFTKMRTSLNSWSFFSLIIIIFVSTPIILIALNIFNPSNEVFDHIKNYLLVSYIKNTLIMALGTGLLSIIIGVSSAYFVSLYDFPLRRFFSWALVLPLAIPDYIGAHVYANIFSYTGYIPTLLREKFGITYNFDIMNLGGAIFVLTLCFYPYVYILVKSFLAKQSNSLIEVSKSLGKNNKQIFWKVLLPISRGAIVGGVTLVILEVLNAYGLPNYFGIQTFSTGIFRVWFSFKDLDTAIKMSAMLLFVTYTIILGEKFLRRRKSYSFSNTKIRPIIRQKLNKKNKVMVLSWLSLVFSFAFIIPILQLSYWASLTYKYILNKEFLILIRNSFGITIISTLIIIIFSIVIANTTRLSKGKLSIIISKGATMGYSIPGAVISIGMLLFFISLDGKLVPLYNLIGIGNSLFLTLSFALLVSAYLVRFLAISYNTIESGFEKVGLKFHEASRTLGKGISKTFLLVDLPMIKNSVLGAGILVFIEIIKELPLTMLLRPFNFNTLSTAIKKFAEDEMLPEASIPSLILIGVCLVLLLIFNKLEKGKKN